MENSQELLPNLASENNFIELSVPNATLENVVQPNAIIEIARVDVAKEEDDPHLCNICLTDKINAVLVPCGHMFFCLKCSRLLNKCAICRCIIKQVVRVYFPF